MSPACSLLSGVCRPPLSSEAVLICLKAHAPKGLPVLQQWPEGECITCVTLEKSWKSVFSWTKNSAEAAVQVLKGHLNQEGLLSTAFILNVPSSGLTGPRDLLNPLQVHSSFDGYETRIQVGCVHLWGNFSDFGRTKPGLNSLLHLYVCKSVWVESTSNYALLCDARSVRISCGSRLCVQNALIWRVYWFGRAFGRTTASRPRWGYFEMSSALS